MSLPHDFAPDLGHDRAPPDLGQRAEQVIAHGSKSFSTAARLFDASTRRSVVLLYAWCRHCDDVVDGQQLGFAQSPQTREASLARVDELARETRRALRGDTRDLSAPFAGLAEVARRHRLPERFALEHLHGFRMDAQGRRYPTLADTIDYAWHVAGVVGAMMAIVMGRRDDLTLARAADLGLAFQLTNIARDVVDDHAAGRVYLPADWLAAEGLHRDSLAAPQHRAALARVVHRLVEAAEPYYASAQRGLPSLPWRSAWAVASARSVYREIGRDVQRRGARAWDRRVRVTRPRQLLLLCNGALDALASRGTEPERSAQARQLPAGRP